MLGLSKKLSLITLSTLLSTTVLAAGSQCTELFKETVQTEKTSTEIKNSSQFTPKTLEIFKTLKSDTDLPFAGTVLNRIEEMMKDQISFQEALRKTLEENHYTEDLIKDRLTKLNSKSTHTEKQWRSILGDLTLAETHTLFYGGDIQNISPTSLIGKYIAETDAKTLFRAFPKKNYAPGFGPEKLMVAVSRGSFEIFKKYILSNMHYMSVVGHANVLHKNQFYGIFGGKDDIRALSDNTPIPLVLFKTSEAQRVNRYLELTADPQFVQWNHVLKQPWQLTDYCAKGGYNCCTHWIGNMPIGDKLVNEYSFPAGYAQDQTPRVQTLKPYAPVNAQQEKVAQVWKAPGYQQFADVIGQHEANVIGEMASPGYVIHTLLGPTATKRVPVVFLITDDHQTEIAPDAELDFEYPF